MKYFQSTGRANRVFVTQTPKRTDGVILDKFVKHVETTYFQHVGRATRPTKNNDKA